MASTRRDDEGMTAFTIRRIRNDIIEECAVAIESRIANESALPITDDETVACAASVRALKDDD